METITVLVTSSVLGPQGQKLTANQIYHFEDSPYLRIMLKSGNVELIDPPHLDYIDKKPVVVEPQVVEQKVALEKKPVAKLEEPKEVAHGTDYNQSGRSDPTPERSDSSGGSGAKSGERAAKSPDAGSEGHRRFREISRDQQ